MAPFFGIDECPVVPDPFGPNEDLNLKEEAHVANLNNQRRFVALWVGWEHGLVIFSVTSNMGGIQIYWHIIQSSGPLAF